MRLIFRKGKTARQHFNQELNKKKREENARRKTINLLKKKKSLPRHQHGQIKQN